MNKNLPILLGAALLAGCATPVPQALSPELLPAKFDRPVGNAWPAADWWQGFGDPALSALIRQAQAGNRDIAVAAAQVLQAEARTRIQGAALLPQLSGGAGASGCGGTACGVPAFSLSLSASYEVDFWGLARDNLRSAQEALKSARFARQAAALSVTANLADRYFELLAIRGRIAIANQNIAAIDGLLQVVQLRVKAGSASHLDLAREEAQLESVEAQLPSLQTQESQALYALAVLLGRPPEGLVVAGDNLDAIAAPAIGAGLPSELLLRRPDVAQAEANLAAAHADVDAARAAFLPNISLSASGGFAGAALGTLLQGPNFGAAYGASLLQSIFDGGTLRGQSDLAKGVEREYIARYQSAVLNAYGDVETALTQFANSGLSEQHLRRLIVAAQEAFQISELQYRQGAADLLTVLQAQQTLFQAQDQLVQTMLASREGAVHVFEALGGGWREEAAERTQLPVPQTGAGQDSSQEPNDHPLR